MRVPNARVTESVDMLADAARRPVVPDVNAVADQLGLQATEWALDAGVAPTVALGGRNDPESIELREVLGADEEDTNIGVADAGGRRREDRADT